ncbi:DUF4199 domain-containing protein [Zobellia amurskyensis]|uniref:DUF4199 domain-containing protein n=1 Tax=Zobellia amurskyensis TaxID=248905 RepID=A0A7X3D3V4_9FLAO|nr:DUF4199 domain-containing protein [Zobellia amurskyensis]MUH37791.1 DUF4199 domain-containing protein [Zobellia amurskyensis]
MENSQADTGKFSLNYGLIVGAVGIAFGFMLYTMDMHYERGLAVQGTQTLILVVGIVLGIFQFKKANFNFLTISEALKVGAGVALIAGILGILYFYVFSNYVEPEYMDNMYEIGKQQALESNPKLTEEQIDQGIEMQKSFAWMSYPLILIINIVIGLIVGLITGLVLKKDKPAY